MEGCVNTVKTRQAKQNISYIRYINWLKEHGCIFPRIDFPVAFWEDGIIGCLAKQDIPPSTAFIFSPMQISINLAAAFKSQISYLFQTHSCYSGHSGASDNILWTFIIFQHLKGENSFWYPYLQTVLQIPSIADWNEFQLEELQDKIITYDLRKWEKRVQKSFNSILQVFKQHPQHFPPSDYKALLYWAWKLITTRSFAQDGGMLIPLADNFNHGNFHIRYQTEKKQELFESRHIGDLDYRDIDNKVHTPTRSIPQQTEGKNRLEQYLETHPLPNCRAIWQIEQELKDFQTSSDDQTHRNYGDIDSNDQTEQNDFKLKTVEQLGEFFFIKATDRRTGYFQGKQAFSSYGRLCNRDLVLDYGFALPNNKFDCVYFRMWKPRTGRVGLVQDQEILSQAFKSQLDCKMLDQVSEIYRLKKRTLNTDVFTYFRKTLGQVRPRLIASPSKVSLEFQVVQKVRELYTFLLSQYRTSLEFDLQEVEEAKGNYQVALVYRIGQKQILLAQLKYLQRLEIVLRRVMLGNIEEHLTQQSEEEIRETYACLKYMKSLRANLIYEQ